jgi:hypothetical protein
MQTIEIAVFLVSLDLSIDRKGEILLLVDVCIGHSAGDNSFSCCPFDLFQFQLLHNMHKQL